MKNKNDNKQRCSWVNDDPLYIAYHDAEWGVPIYDDRLLFEFLVLEGMQAGLSWLTILKKRNNYRKTFNQFKPNIIAGYDEGKIETLMKNTNIIRNKLKIQSIIKNANAFLLVKKEWGNFSNYIWNFVNERPIQNCWQYTKEVPCETIISITMSKDLKKRGFSFVGSKICYAFMQAVGMVNDHTVNCFRHKEIKKL